MIRKCHNYTVQTNPRPQGGTLIFSYIRRLGSFFGVQNFEFQYFFYFFFWGGGGGVRKMNIFGGYEDFVDIYIFFFWGGGHHIIGLYLGVISMYFRVFS